jgi:protein-S-isoprenylcysteine O-methyltransferase Ste14
MYLFLFPLLLGFALAGASAFTAAYSRRFGETGGLMVTAVLRNLLGIPLWLIGYFWAWVIPSPWLSTPSPFAAAVGWLLVIVGLVPVIMGHFYVGMRSHLPSVRDRLVRRGLYAYVRHPIYAGVLVMLPGAVLIRPSLTVPAASAIVFAWLFVQARLDEIDLVQRLPAYQDYMREVPRFIPRFRRCIVRTARPTTGKSADR